VSPELRPELRPELPGTIRLTTLLKQLIECHVLEVFPESVVAAGTLGFEFTALADFEKRYTDMDFGNFAWYQCKLHLAARKIYDDGGAQAFIRLWNGLRENKGKMTDAQLAEFLKAEVGQEAARVLTDW
jgi:hypothetical protein